MASADFTPSPSVFVSLYRLGTKINPALALFDYMLKKAIPEPRRKAIIINLSDYAKKKRVRVNCGR